MEEEGVIRASSSRAGRLKIFRRGSAAIRLGFTGPPFGLDAACLGSLGWLSSLARGRRDRYLKEHGDEFFEAILAVAFLVAIDLRGHHEMAFTGNPGVKTLQ